MRIAIYILTKNAKANYKHESFAARQNAGLMVVRDILLRSGYGVEYCSSANAHKYDIILASITSDCDWYAFIRERVTWQDGEYRVIVGGAGVLNVRPFLPYADYFVLGRAEGVISQLIKAVKDDNGIDSDSVVRSSEFNSDKNYYINQSTKPYPYAVKLENEADYKESGLGCNHRCLFCAYTWHRKSCGDVFHYGDLWNKNKDVELALLDMASKGIDVDFNRLRTTAIDGLSERLRYKVNKKISRKVLRIFLSELAKCEKPHQVKFYNIIGYPTETKKDRNEFFEDIAEVDKSLPKTDKQTSILVHSTPFRAMPATPMACEPMSYKNYRGLLAKTVGRNYKGNILYQGNSIWAVESMGIESLPSVIHSVIALRGTEDDSKQIEKIATSKKYNNLPSKKKKKVLESMFDVEKLFSGYTPETLPTRYLKSYAKVEKMWN